MLEGLKVAKAVGARVMRCVQGTLADRRNDQTPLEACMEETIRVFRAVKSQALDLGVKIALENHAGDMQAREILTIIQESGPEFVGSCLDTGNPIWVMENPVVTMEVLGPHVLTTHVRDSGSFRPSPRRRRAMGRARRRVTSICGRLFPCTSNFARKPR